ncbi:MAG: quinol:electron acceptor oxidoreductase subunit ActD [Thermoguttaceae bacterium]|jgi:mono/diheme cytochrome c family protein
MADNVPQLDSSAGALKVAAAIGQFASAGALKAAAEAVRDEGYRHWDAHSPYPIHGIERSMGIRPTVLPWLVFGAGLTGAAVAILLQWWTNAVDYPFLISGKPLFSLPANIPVAFELVILFSALAAFAGALLLSRLPQFHHPVFASEEFRRATSDGFFISIEASDPEFDEEKTAGLLKALGAESVELCRLPAAAPRLPRVFYTAAALAVCLALLPPLCVAWYRAAPKRQPRIHPLHDMAFQPKYKAQAASDLFADGRAMRPPVPGTVARGEFDEDPRQAVGKDEAGNYVTSIPLAPGAAIDRAMMLRGKDRFRIYCAPCHGLTGGMPEGAAGGDAEKWEGMVSIRAARRAAGGEGTWTPPRVLTSAYVQDQPDGKLFETIGQGVVNQGVRTMPGYAVQIPREDRWAIVLYLRALGRSQNASAGEVPPPVREASVSEEP